MTNEMTSKVAVVFGYGPNVGVHVARAFKDKGYQVAVVSRSDRHSQDAKDYLQIRADMSNPLTVKPVFDKVVKELGHPSVVVYNASSQTVNAQSTLDEQTAAFQSDNNINIVSAHVAAQLAVASFRTHPEDLPKTFIYTGNKLPFMVVLPLLSQGVGKAGAAHLIHYLSEEHKKEGFRFYFADEREASGDPVYSAIDGSAHAAFYAQLIAGETHAPWNATFLKGQGYVRFSESVVEDAVVMNL